MSYPKKPSGRQNSADNKSNSRLSEGRKEKLLAIQERETLKGLLIRKFAEKYGKAGKGTTDVIQKEVVEFMKNEKLTEENLRRLEDRIKDLTGASKREQQSQRAPEPSHHQAPLMAASRGVLENTSTGNLVRPPSNQGNQITQAMQASRRRDDDAISNADSVGPRSVYHLNEDDEWAAIMKYDSDLYKKERELEVMMEKERKKKVKMELDSQIDEKRRMKDMEKDELNRYMGVQQTILTNFDSREKQKEDEKKQRNLQEKLSRDKQLQEENLRKKMERKQEREMDALLVRKIKEEIDNEQQQNMNKKLNERDRLLRVMIENEENKKKMNEDARREKAEDIKAQEEYTRLIEKQEADREMELQNREARAKKLMNMMADTVIKDQKAMLLDEEKKILKYYLEREDKAMKDEELRKRKLYEQKLEVKKFLDQQVEEKNGRKVQENEFNKKQAEIWKKDTEDFYDNEKRKTDYIKDVNKQHAEILKQQMGTSGGKKPFGKMDQRELLLNKDRLKVVAANHDGFVKTQL